jgi:GNAT superfamily N-acetyltransferase
MRDLRFIDDSNHKLLKKAWDLVRDVFWEFEAGEYEDEGVLEFENYIEYAGMVRRMREGSLAMLGCFENKRLAGVLAMVAPGHISLLFVAKAYQRKGIARDLTNEMVRCISQMTETQELTVNSSPYALPVYQKLGFVPAGPEQTLNGMRFTPMKRVLASAEETAETTR